MAAIKVSLAFDEDLMKQIDFFANNESLTRNDLICNSVKMYINSKQKLQELYAYGESIAARNNFTEDDVMEEIKSYKGECNTHNEKLYSMLDDGLYSLNREKLNR